MIGEEAIDSIKTGVALILFTAILGYVVFNVGFGRELLNSAVEEIEESAFETTSRSFQGFTGDGRTVTGAAAYAFIGYNENEIASITCYVHDARGVTGYGMDDTCLKNHLGGTVIMKAEYDRNEGLYRLSLYPGQGRRFHA